MKWEYLVVSLDGIVSREEFRDWLNEWALSGWEFVAFSVLGADMILKRSRGRSDG